MRFKHPVPFMAVGDFVVEQLSSSRETETANAPAAEAVQRVRRGQAAFTMIEIALCLAIIGFALVAIIGVLPTGMGVQKDNREETIINQEAAMWIDTIRSGALGNDDLTNYVIAITNIVTEYTITPSSTNAGTKTTYTYTPTFFRIDNGANNPAWGLTNGLIIVGLLSKPKLEPPTPVTGTYLSNYIVAIVRSMSGAAVEKMPQKDLDVLEGAFSYRMVVENMPYVPFHTLPVDLSPEVTTGMTFEQLVYRTNLARVVWNLEANSHDLRVTFHWPRLPNGVGNGRQHFRNLVGGSMLISTNHNNFGQDLYFFQPSTYGAR